MSDKENINEQNNDNNVEHSSPISLDEAYLNAKEEARKLEKKLRKKGGKPQPIIITQDNKVKKVNELTLEEQAHEFLKCAKDPIYFIETYLTVFDQTQGDGGKIVPFKLFEIQKDLIRDYQNNRYVVANKYRQAGISTTTCAYIAWYVMFSINRNVAIVANKLDTAKDELMGDVVDFIDSCPKFLRPEPSKKDTQKLKKYDNECSLGAFSSTGLRGYTPTLIFWDETAWTDKNDIFWTSAAPSLQTGGKAIFVSCVTKDTYIYTDKGIKQMKDFIPNEKLGAHYIKDSYIGGLNKLRETNIFFNNGYVDTFKIKTIYNEIESSENHKFWTYKDDQYKWVKAKDLEVGDYISQQKGCEMWGNNDDCSDFKPSENKKIKNVFKPTKITKDIAYFIGLYISEGYSINNQITITCGDDISGILNDLNIKFNCDDDLHYEISSKNICEFFTYLGFDLSKKAPEKIIPPRVLEMSRDNIIAMLQGVMDGDGYTLYNSKKNHLKVGLCLSSLELIKQIRIILANFGVLTEYDEFLTPPTERVKAESMGYRIVANSEYAKLYHEKIGFRFKRKSSIVEQYDRTQIKYIGVHDNIPNGSEILKDLYGEVKYYGIHKDLKKHNINTKYVIEKQKGVVASSRKTILNFINFFKNKENKISETTLEKYSHIVDENMVWTPIKTIEKSKNWTYDFSMSKKNPSEKDEFNMQITYNQFITHNTPNGLDPVFYKHFEGAKRGENDFKPVELWWYNDPRYNVDLEWVKNKGKKDEIRHKDENWSIEKRAKMAQDGWEATSPWLEEQIRQANGDKRKIAQEILCIFGDSLVTVRNKKTNKIETLKISELYERIEKCNVV